MGQDNYEEREKLACAHYLGIDPSKISKVETSMDGGGHFTGLRVIIDISTGREVRDFVNTHCPPKLSSVE